MNADRIAELRRLCEAATPGPFEVAVWDGELDQVEHFRQHLSYGTGPIWGVWCPDHPLTIGCHPRPEHAVQAAITGNGPNSEANATFIAAARTALPEALDAIDKRDDAIRCFLKTLDDMLPSSALIETEVRDIEDAAMLLRAALKGE